MTTSLAHKPWLATLLVFIALAVALEPLFFTIDRVMVFSTVPRDDYARFLLWLVGAPGGAFPESPYGYRVITMVAAAPLYDLLPSLRLTNLPPGLTPDYIQATAAIAALSYLSLIGAGTLAYRMARDRVGLSRLESVLSGILLSGLVLYSQFFSIDAFAIMLVAGGLCLLNNRWGFALLVVPGTFANEKIAIVFALWLTVRCVFSAADRARFKPQWATALLAVALYVLALRFLHLPGNAYQLEPGGYLVTLAANLRASASARGLLLNLLPVLVLLAVALAGWRRAKPAAVLDPFSRLDLLIIPGLVVVALMMTQMFQTGRIVMHAAPLYVVPAAAAIGRWARAGNDQAA